MSYQFSSNLKVNIITFLAEKRALGYSYKTGEEILKQFDKFCNSQYPDATTITHELGLAWSVRRIDEKGSTFEGRICTVRELAICGRIAWTCEFNNHKYLCVCGYGNETKSFRKSRIVNSACYFQSKTSLER